MLNKRYVSHNEHISNIKHFISLIIFVLSLGFIFFVITSCGAGIDKATLSATAKVIEENYPSDNFVEEAVEQKIKDSTGLDIDLTPASPEVK